MAKAPAFQFYAAEYLADMNVQLLTVEQEGIYIRLLSFCWREGSLPNDDRKLASLCKGCPPEVLAPVKSLFEVSEDGESLLHKRLESERKKQKAWTKKCSTAGKISAEVRKAKKEEELQVNVSSTLVQQDAQLNANSAFASSSSSSSAKQEQVPIASTAIAVPAERGKLLGTLPLNDGSDYQIFEADVGEMARLYPAVDVAQAFRSMKGWMISHPARRKTKKGIKSFITSWLSREQDNAKPQGAGNGNRNHGKTGGNLDAAAQALAYLEARNCEVIDEASGAPAGTSEPCNPADIRGRLIDLSAG